MRITKLSIKKYKNLEDFSWELNPDYPVAVIVGKNGSGKTNLLEAIITIFQDLQLYSQAGKQNTLPEFEFELVYQHLDDVIRIANETELKIWRNDEKIGLDELETLRQDISGGTDILPKTVFVYYAGSSERLKKLVNKSISEYESLSRQPSFQYALTQPLFYYEPIHYRCVFLALFVSTLDSIKEDFLKTDLKIDELESVDFTISRPDWNRSSNDETFWDAPTYLQRFLRFVREKSEIVSIERNRTGFIYKLPMKVFDEEFEVPTGTTTVGKENYRNFFGGESGLFRELNNLVSSAYLKNMEIFFRKNNTKKLLEFSDLSEGEWQRIAIRGAMEIFQGEETLFLLDEPDTFAHPRWQWDFVPDLEKTIGENRNTQAIFITHSPLVLSSVKKNASFMEGGKIEILEDNFGQDANMSLINMGVNPQFEEVDIDFQNYFDLIKSGKGETKEGLTERARLEEIYGMNHEKFDSADILISFYR